MGIMLEIFYQQSLAIELIKRKARIAMIQKTTGLSIKWLRKAFHEYHGFSARAGNEKQSTLALTRTIRHYKEATIFAVCYRNAETLMRRKDVEIMIDAFDAFKKIHPNAYLDFSEACVIINDLRNNVIELVKCSHCGCWNLVNARLCIKERCGICKTQIKVVR
jgi:flagellar transcriptional activator FlhC